MAKTKKALSLLTAMVIALSSFAFYGASASSVKVIPGDTENGLEVELKPGKSEYGYGDTASIKVSVKNNYGFDVDKLIISVYSSDCKLPAGEKCKSDVLKLEKGKTTEFTVHAKLGSSAKLNFFQKILFFFRNLFSRSESFEKLSDGEKTAVSVNGDNDVFENTLQANVKFSGAICRVDVSAVYDFGFSDKEQKLAEEVDSGIEKTLNSSGFKEAILQDLNTRGNNVENQKKAIGQTLGTLSEKGLVAQPEYDEEEGVYWFLYNLGGGETAIGGVRIKQNNSQKNAGGSPFLTLEGFNKEEDYSDIESEYGKYFGASVIKADYDSCRNLSGRSFLCFSCHGNVYFNNIPYIQLPGFYDDEMFKADLKDKNAGSIFEYVFEYVDGVIANFSAKEFGVLFPAFFRSKKIDNSIVFLESCCAFGKDKREDTLAQSFISAGAKAVIGFQNEVYYSYSLKFMKTFAENIAMGKNAGEAVAACKAAHGDTDGDLAQPYLLGDAGTTILSCGPDGGKLAGLRVHYTDTTGGGNGEGDLFLIVLKAEELSGKSNEEIADTAEREIIKLGIRGSAAVDPGSITRSGSFYNIEAIIAN